MSFITFGLCKKLNTTVIVRTGMIIAIVGQIVGILAPTSLSVQMVSAVIRSIGWGLLAALIHSMVGDAIEYGHWRTGHKAPGTTYAAQGVGNKLGVLIGSGVFVYKAAMRFVQFLTLILMVPLYETSILRGDQTAFSSWFRQAMSVGLTYFFEYFLYSLGIAMMASNGIGTPLLGVGCLIGMGSVSRTKSFTEPV